MLMAIKIGFEVGLGAFVAFWTFMFFINILTEIGEVIDRFNAEKSSDKVTRMDERKTK